jgi:hypothetical protein
MKRAWPLRRPLLACSLLLALPVVVWVDAGEQVPQPAPKADTGTASRRAAPVAEPQLAMLDLKPLRRGDGPASIHDAFAVRSWLPPKPVRSGPPPKPEAPPLPFTYTGKLVEEGKPTLVFLTKQNDNYVVRAGDVLENTYRVEEVGPETMTLSYLPLNVRQTLSIGSAK